MGTDKTFYAAVRQR